MSPIIIIPMPQIEIAPSARLYGVDVEHRGLRERHERSTEHILQQSTVGDGCFGSEYAGCALLFPLSALLSTAPRCVPLTTPRAT